jgi:ABC-type transporter MlaC component
MVRTRKRGSGKTVKNIRIVLAFGLVMVIGLAGVSFAGETAPEAVVRQIYSGKTPTTKAIDIIDNQKLRARFLSKDLAAAVKKDIDQAAESNDVGALDFDPVSDSQDPTIKDLKIEPLSAQGDKAQVKVSFSTYDPGRDELLYDLVMEGGEWRVYDISKQGNANDAWSLRALLSLK